MMAALALVVLSGRRNLCPLRFNRLLSRGEVAHLRAMVQCAWLGGGSWVAPEGDRHETLGCLAQLIDGAGGDAAGCGDGTPQGITARTRDRRGQRCVG
jgi:hypothetical protein